MTNVSKEGLFFSCSMHDRGLYQQCVILIALKNTSSDSFRNLIPISLMLWHCSDKPGGGLIEMSMLLIGFC